MFKSFLSVLVALFALGALDTALAARTAGCGKTPTITSGTRTIQHNGKSRTYIVTLPSGYSNTRAYKLIFGQHWLGGTATDVQTGRTVATGTWAYYGLQQRANNSAIFVAPQGNGNGWANSGNEDVTLMDAIANQLEADLCIDTTLRFSIGFSFGGFMSYCLACQKPERYRAVVVQSGSSGIGSCGACSNADSVGYLGVHGIRDGTLNISGGRSMRDLFVGKNGCQSQSPREPSQGTYQHVTTPYSGCRADYPVTWAAFDEGHIAAPHDGGPGDSGNGWVPQVAWDFINQFQGSDGGTTSTPTSTGSTTTRSTTTTSGGCTVPKWGQCGGDCYTGCKTCEAGSTCTFSNQWYSQCL